MGLAGLSVQGFRFRVSGLEFRVWVSGEREDSMIRADLGFVGLPCIKSIG